MAGKKVQMMDAGTALFEMEGGFGTALGQIRAELKEFGKVSDDGEDIVLDFSTAWRKRFISCHLESAGENGDRHKYAAVFKEGSASTLFRGIVHAAMILIFAAILAIPHYFFPGLANFVLSVVCVAGIAGTAYGWIVPSSKSTATARKIIAKTGSLS